MPMALNERAILLPMLDKDLSWKSRNRKLEKFSCPVGALINHQ
jgi:hypothetical protein